MAIEITNNKSSLEYSDIYLVPNYSDITSRKEVDVSSMLESSNSNVKINLKVPVISANMDTVTGNVMARSINEAGAMGAIHRFMSIEDSVKEFQLTGLKGNETFVSIGVNKDWQERASALYDAGARAFIVDIAHGHSKMMKDTIQWLKKKYDREIFVLGGNVGTKFACADLNRWGADGVKIGLAGGFVCETKNVTGVLTPMFSTVLACSDYAQEERGLQMAIVADGGARHYGDIAKALGAGANAVMSGYFFAGCPENPSESLSFDPETNSYVPVYRGMASRDAMRTIRTENQMPTPEGRTTTVNLKPSVKVVVEEIKGGLQSAFSYMGSRNLNEFQRDFTYSVK
jgi:IMP dehydrogenase